MISTISHDLQASNDQIMQKQFGRFFGQATSFLRIGILREPQSSYFTPKLRDFFTPHKGGGEAEKPFRAITFNRLN